MLYVAAEFYSKSDIEMLAKEQDIQGVVLGDPYCQKRMFACGEPELPELAVYAHSLGLKVIVQTPCYLTDRIFEKQLDLLRYLRGRGACDGGVLVQDVGFASVLHKEAPELPLIWSQIGRTRNKAENVLFYQFLCGIGITGAELIDPSLAGHLEKLGLSAIYTNKEIRYSTVNRECYYIHELGLWDRSCGRGCVNRDVRLVNQQRGIDMAVNGYRLNSSYGDIDLPELCDRNILLRGAEPGAILAERKA